MNARFFTAFLRNQPDTAVLFYAQMEFIYICGSYQQAALFS
jgi:hypothetical protein